MKFIKVILVVIAILLAVIIVRSCNSDPIDPPKDTEDKPIVKFIINDIVVEELPPKTEYQGETKIVTYPRRLKYDLYYESTENHGTGKLFWACQMDKCTITWDHEFTVLKGSYRSTHYSYIWSNKSVITENIGGVKKTRTFNTGMGNKFIEYAYLDACNGFGDNVWYQMRGPIAEAQRSGGFGWSIIKNTKYDHRLPVEM